MTTKDARMDSFLSVFNCHANLAKARADRLFKQVFGKPCWNKQIRPYHKAGIMSIFHDVPNKYTYFWVEAVHLIVNAHCEYSAGTGLKKETA